MINIANLEFKDLDDFFEEDGHISVESPTYVDMMMVSAYISARAQRWQPTTWTNWKKQGC